MTDPHAQKAFPVSWDQFHRDARALAWRLNGAGPFEAIVCVTRGGLVPAAIVARELGTRVIETVCIASYHDYDRQGGLQVLKGITADVIRGDGGAGVLVVDDLVDTGATAKAVRDMLPRAHFATRLRQAARAAPRRHVRDRGEPGHLDLFSLGYGADLPAADRPERRLRPRHKTAIERMLPSLGAGTVRPKCLENAMKSALMTSVALAVLATAGGARADAMDDLVAAAKKEGQLTVIALPRDWCGYGPIIDGFKAKYGIAVNELNPDAGSGDEIEAIKANKTNKGPQAPDVIDVGLSFGPTAKADGLIQPYKVSTWATIPDSAKDADGYWYGDYYGVLSMVVNTDIVKTPPTDWADLLTPAYKGKVALSGDPRTSNQATQAVFSAGLATNGGKVETAAADGLKPTSPTSTRPATSSP